MQFTKTIERVDSHTEGNTTRVIVGGADVPPGKNLWEIKDHLQTNNDGLRRLLNREPRGGGLMCSVPPMTPLRADTHFSIIIMEQESYVPVCGHCAMDRSPCGTGTSLFTARALRRS